MSRWHEVVRRLLPAHDAAAILVYHRVADLDDDLFGQAVRPAAFERQLRILRRYGAVTPVGDIIDRIARGDSVHRLIGVTFDDGYVDTLTTAAPIAGRLGVPITVFVTTRPVLDGGEFWWDRLARAVLRGEVPDHGILTAGDLTIRARGETERVTAVHAIHARLRVCAAERREALLRQVEGQCGVRPAAESERPMRPDELRVLAALPAVEIGAHTVTHPSLAALSPGDQRMEIGESRALLERALGKPVQLLAYPFGKDDNVSATTRGLAKAAGFTAALTTIPRRVNSAVDLYAVPRLTVHEWPDAEFTAKVEALLGPPVA